MALKIPGIAGAPVMRRVYPRGTLAAQVLGLVGTEGNGLSGLEYSRNALLHGQTGQRHVVSDAIGQPVSINEAHPEEPGHVGVADARREHPAAHRRRARRRSGACSARKTRRRS